MTAPTTATTTSSSRMRRLSVRFGGIGRRMAGQRLFPFWSILRHTGRRSGTAYATPIVAFRVGDGFLIPLPFGDGTQWLHNLRAADRAGLRRAGREYDITDARVITRFEAAPNLPVVIRGAARAFGIGSFVRVRIVPEVPAPGT